MAEWKKSIPTEQLNPSIERYQRLFELHQRDLSRDSIIKKYIQKKGKDLIKGNIIEDGSNETLHKVFQLKLLNSLLENEENFKIYNETLLKNINNFCNENKDKISKRITNKIYEEYKKLKKEIEKIKNNNKKWVKAIPNKLKKQSTHLMGEAKLKSLSAKNADVLKKMAEENRLTLPDFRMALKYKLMKEYLGEISNKVCNSPRNTISFCKELKTFYEDFDFKNNKDRNQIIKNIYSDYKSIEKRINGQVVKKLKIKENRQKDDKTGYMYLVGYEEQEITFDSYDNFINNFKQLYASSKTLISNMKSHSKDRYKLIQSSYYKRKEMEETVNYDSLVRFGTPDNIKAFFDLPLEELKSPKGHNLYNIFKLFDNNSFNETDIHAEFSFIFVICQVRYKVETEFTKENIDEEYYILKSTRDKADKILEKEAKEAKEAKEKHKTAFKPALDDIKNKPAHLKPTRPVPPTPKFKKVLDDIKKSGEIKKILENMANPPTRPIPPPKPSHLKKTINPQKTR